MVVHVSKLQDNIWLFRFFVFLIIFIQQSSQILVVYSWISSYKVNNIRYCVVSSPSCFIKMKDYRSVFSYGVNAVINNHEGYDDSNDEIIETFSSSDEVKQSSIALYIHIPFCRRRCRYCDFAIIPIGQRSNSELDVQQGQKSTSTSSYYNGLQNMMNSYSDSICNEIQYTMSNNNNNNNQTTTKIPLNSIYFGGGTPSLAPIEIIERIFHQITNMFIILNNTEITIEIDPGTFTKDKLQSLRSIGFNRLSLGVQSFDDTILESLGRIHRIKDVYESMQLINEVYGNTVNLSIDLISGLPGLSLAKWTETLSKAIHLHPKPLHLSIYDLQIEKGTVFGNWYADNEKEYLDGLQQETLLNHQNKSILPSENDAVFMYKYASHYLRLNGYEHYEISSYAFKSTTNEQTNNNHEATKMMKRNRSTHNQIYWALDSQWYAFGLGATSYVDGRLIARPRTLIDYQKWVDEIVLKSKLCIVGTNDQNDTIKKKKQPDLEMMMDIVLKRLRTSEGISIQWIRDQFIGDDSKDLGDAYIDAIMKGTQLGLDLKLVVFDEQHDRLYLTEPDGFLLSNTIISNIFVHMEDIKLTYPVVEKC